MRRESECATNGRGYFQVQTTHVSGMVKVQGLGTGEGA